MRIADGLAAGALFALVSPAFGSIITLDTFDRADTTDMRPQWTEVFPDFRIEAGRARSSDAAVSIYALDTGLASTDAIGVEAIHNGEAVNQYVALFLRHADLANNVFIKLQDNGQTGAFNRLFFNYGNNAGPWSGMSGGASFVPITPTTRAVMRAAVYGEEVFVQLDLDVDGIWDQTLSRGGLPVAALGTGVGLGGYGGPVMDDFRGYVGELIPEPLTATLMAIGVLALGGRRRRS